MQNKDISTTFLKGLAVLRAFGSDAEALTPAEIGRLTGFDRASVRRLCLTLVEAGFATQSDRGFHLSPRVLTLAGNFLGANEVGLSIQPHLNAYADRLGSDISFAVRDGTRALYVAQSTLNVTRISFGFTTGSTLPLLPTAIGRMLLAHMPPEERAALVAEAELVRFTSKTVMDRREIGRQIDRASIDAAAVVVDEFENDICGLAVPVGPVGQARAVLGTTLPTRAPDLETRMAEALSILREAERRLSGLRMLDHC